MVQIPDGPARENFNFQRIILAVGGVLMLAKFIAFLLTNSVSILTDALESIVNVAAGAIGLYALWMSAQPADRTHPYGHGKIELISASIEGTMICAAGIMIVITSFSRIFHPAEIHELDIGLVIIAVSAVVNFALGWTAIKKGRKNQSIALESSGKHLCTDTYDSIGILIGLGLVYAGAHMGYDVRILDGIVAMLFGVFIMYTGFKVIHKSGRGIMDTYDEEIILQVTRCINHIRVPEIVDVHNLRSIRYGAAVHVDMHMVVPGMLTVQEADGLIENLRKQIYTETGSQMDITIMAEPCECRYCRTCQFKCADRKQDFEERRIFGPMQVTELDTPDNAIEIDHDE